MAGEFGNCRQEGEVELRSGKKPEELLKRLMEISTKEGDLVLDYHLGSGTTCAVAHKMGRRYIGIEQIDYDKNSAVFRLKNVIKGDDSGISEAVGWKGGGDFVYCELMEWNEKYVTTIAGATSSDDLLKIWNLMTQRSFLSYKVKPELFDKQAKDFKDLTLEDQKKFLFECLDKNHLYVNLSEIDDKDYGATQDDKKINSLFYGGI